MDKENPMDYIVISDLVVCEKTKGEVLTEKELIKAGANIDALIGAGHVEAKGASKLASEEGEI